MSLNKNKLPFLVLGFSGSFAIVGAGFSAWIFGDSINVPPEQRVQASINVVQEAKVGNFYMDNERETRDQLIVKNDKIHSPDGKIYYKYNGVDYEYMYPMYNFSLDHYRALSETHSTSSPTTYNLVSEFKKMAERYRYRSIVFGEGDIANGNEGLEFHRFKATDLVAQDGSVSSIQTFVPENIVHGQYMVHSGLYDQYVQAGYEIQVGVNVSFPSKDPTYNHRILSDYITLAPDYSSNLATFDVMDQNVNKKFISVSDPLNKPLFKWNEATYLYQNGEPGIKGVCRESMRGDAHIDYFKVFDFYIDLHHMFSYKSKDLIPDDDISIRQIHSDIETARAANKNHLWSANLKLYTTYKIV